MMGGKTVIILHDAIYRLGLNLKMEKNSRTSIQYR